MPRKRKKTKTVSKRKTQPVIAQPVEVSPYSLTALITFFQMNAGLIFAGLSILIAGFILGSLWTENKMLKDGYSKNVTYSLSAELP